ncbi:MAG TPA: hypothetical protein VLZ55_12640 [Rhodanobacter sp.]|nr:hypothetical protein [Rhodanobacter sp.]
MSFFDVAAMSLGRARDARQRMKFMTWADRVLPGFMGSALGNYAILGRSIHIDTIQNSAQAPLMRNDQLCRDAGCRQHQ